MRGWSSSNMAGARRVRASQRRRTLLAYAHEMAQVDGTYARLSRDRARAAPAVLPVAPHVFSASVRARDHFGFRAEEGEADRIHHLTGTAGRLLSATACRCHCRSRLSLDRVRRQWLPCTRLFGRADALGC